MSDWDDDEVERESPRDRIASSGRRARHRLGRALRALHLTRLADALDPPLTPWWLQRPMGYIEHFAGPQEPSGERLFEGPFEDVLLAQMRRRDDAKRKKLIEVAMTEPDPLKAGQAAAELRHMILQGNRA